MICRDIKSAKGWVLSCPPHWLALVIKTPTWDPDHLLDSDYHLDQFYPSAHPPHPQKKACWCRSQELRDTNDSWTSDEATQHFWIPHTGVVVCARYFSLERGCILHCGPAVALHYRRMKSGADLRRLLHGLKRVQRQPWPAPVLFIRTLCIRPPLLRPLYHYGHAPMLCTQ